MFSSSFRVPGTGASGSRAALAAATPEHRFRRCHCLPLLFLLFGSRRCGGSEHPDSDFVFPSFSNATHSTTRKNTLWMRIVSQHPIDRTVSLTDDLARNRHQSVDECLELDTQQPRLLRPALLCLRARLGKQQRGPAFKFHARAVITMYAQLLSKLSTGALKALTPPCIC